MAEAIDKEKYLYFHYTKGSGGCSMRTIKPLRYITYRSVKCIAGDDFLTGEVRHFALQRMRDIEIVDKPKRSYVICGTP